MRGRGPGRRGPGIVRTAAKTAVIAGTATATVDAVHRVTGSNETPSPEMAAAASAGMTSDQIQRLTELAELRDRGILTDEEFQAQKQRILSGH
jgi:hypothetical protein